MTTTDNTDIDVQQSTRMGAFDQRDEGLVRYLGLDPSKPEDRAAVAVCRHYGFDPLLRHVVVIPRSGVYITRDGMLNVAHRSGQLDGIVVEQNPELDGDHWVAKVSVYRKDMSRPFTFPGRYPANGSNKQYGPEMALKAAEAHALRRAFDIGGLPTLEEQRPPGDAPAPQERPAARLVTSEEIMARSQNEAAPAAAAAPDKTETNPTRINRRMHVLFGKADCTDREDRLIITRFIIGRDDIQSSNDLGTPEVQALVDQLAAWERAGELGQKITDILNTAAIREAEAAEQETER
jgi:hypothetical protein